jgi:hypothetical protein
MSRASVAAQSGRRSAAPEAAAAAHARAEARAGLRWSAAQVRGRRVLVVPDATEMTELALLGEAAELLVLAADPLARTMAAGALPDGARLLDGTLADGVPAGIEAEALVWLSAGDDPGTVESALAALMGALGPGMPVVVGCDSAGGSTLELLRARLPGAHEAASRSRVAADVGPPDGSTPETGRHYLTTAEPGPPTSAALEVAGPAAWLAVGAERDARIAVLEQRLLEAEQADREREELRRQLLAAETELARIPELRDELDQLRHDRDLMRQDRDERIKEIERARNVLADVMGSLSWRITRPLRALKGRRR